VYGRRCACRCSSCGPRASDNYAVPTLRLPRWPFLAALSTVLIGVLVWWITPVVQQHYRDAQASRQAAKDRQTEAAIEAKLRPAATALARVSMPGISPCQPGPLSTRGVICGKGAASTVVTASALTKQLRVVGATHISAKCVATSHLGAFCRVTGKLAGYDLGISETPQISIGSKTTRVFGVQLAGGLGILDISMRLPPGTPLALPST
jgi:hypothetical protein